MRPFHALKTPSLRSIKIIAFCLLVGCLLIIPGLNRNSFWVPGQVKTARFIDVLQRQTADVGDIETSTDGAPTAGEVVAVNPAVNCSRQSSLVPTLKVPKLNHTEIENRLLVFTRVPKTGSENFAYVLQSLSRRNGFLHKRYSMPIPRFLDDHQQSRFVNLVTKLKRPASYDRHVYFVDFRKFGSKVPLHFSLVRDPVAKFISRYHYARIGNAGVYDQMKAASSLGVRGLTKSQWKKKDLNNCVLTGDPECAVITGTFLDLTIPYFCGQHAYCKEVNSEAALLEAMVNVDMWYPVVGLLEDIPVTLQVAERQIPRFFRNASTVYYKELKDPHKNRQKRKPGLNVQAANILRQNLTTEYIFYNFIKERLYKQALHFDISVPTS